MAGKAVAAGICAVAGWAATVGLSHAADEKLFTIEVTATALAEFEGECLVTGPSGEQRLVLRGEAPFRREVHGVKLSCSVTQSTPEGSLTVEIRSSGNNVSRSRTQGQGSTIRMVVA